MVHHTCPTCKIEFSIRDGADMRFEESGDSIYCPNGHTMSYSFSQKDKEIKRLKEEVEVVKKKLDRSYDSNSKVYSRLYTTEDILKNTFQKVYKKHTTCPYCKVKRKDVGSHVYKVHLNEIGEEDLKL